MPFTTLNVLSNTLKNTFPMGSRIAGMKWKLFLFLCLAMMTNRSVSQQPFTSKVHPSEVQLSEKRLLLIDEMLEKSVKEGEIPGAVALVMRNGKLAYLKSFGHSNSRGDELKTSAIFRIASQTKAITSTAVMMLWEEGKFALDDPISKWIPQFKNPKILDTLYSDGSYRTIPANGEITIRHLLTHTSGMGYGPIDADLRFRKIFEEAGATEIFTSDNTKNKEIVEKMAVLPLHHQPGEKFTYGVGLDVLGYFIEIVSGMPLDEFLRSRLFEPLGMDDTYFYLPESKVERLVEVQTKKNGEWVPFFGEFFDVDYPKSSEGALFSGGAGLSSTAEDYAKFLQMYLNKGVFNGKRILSRKTVEFIMSNQFEDLWPNDGKYYGLAFSIVNEQGKSIGGMGSVGTFDWGGYFDTKYFADPDEGLIGILLKQTQGLQFGADTTTDKFIRLIYQAIDN